ncbi:hypothetical protein [Bradyrhizobium sp. Tv2a-2]|uniref:hypothetical protein n=1 Tax=Bradyrhizobium sp. Tv2a-2 TaxID=113395 RepID=UPI0003F66226|nr:hypothetical protein [Bradyrhizobium sp. Tv2a-2]
MDFHAFKAPVEAQFKRLTKHDLFCVDVDGDALWEHYLASFPEGTNPIFRKRTEHDCSSCRRFVKVLGGVVAIVDGELKSVWDVKIKEPAYAAVAGAMSEFVKSKAIDRPFLHGEKHVGTDKNHGEVDGAVRTFNHFYADIPWGRNEGKTFFCQAADIPTKIGEMKTTQEVFLRSLQTVSQEAIDTVLELIANKSLYRGEEHKFVVTEFAKLKQAHDLLPAGEARVLFTWANYDKVPPSVARVRNTAIGTLLINLSENMELEQAVGKFDAVMAPTNYKRPTALVSKAMVEKAREAVVKLGIGDALERRHARLTDISVNDILFADRSARKVMNGDVFDQVVVKAPAKAQSLDKVETVGVEEFVRHILPKVDSIEVMLENRHAGNLVSLIAPQHKSAKPLFKWGNGFSWTYNGEVTDSIKEKVKRAGGNVSGDLCCRLAWFNYDDLDLHMKEPSGHHIFFGTKSTVSPSGGRLDVDMNAGRGTTREPVENIFYANRATMKEGEYRLSVNQYARREVDNVGFDIEIDWLGEVTHIHYDKALIGSAEIAHLRYTRAKGIEIIRSLPSTQVSRSLWGIKTQDFHRVTTVMLSPNHWAEGNGTGNKHYFFMLDGCVNEERPRGFFNEFLIDELSPHRKVIEIVGAKSKVESTVDQLSGLGFSSTQRNELLVRAKGSFTRTVRVQF